MGCSSTKVINETKNVYHNQLEVLSKKASFQKKSSNSNTKLIRLSVKEKTIAVQNFNKHKEEAINNEIVIFSNMSIEHDIYMDLLTALSKNENLISFSLINSNFLNSKKFNNYFIDILII